MSNVNLMSTCVFCNGGQTYSWINKGLWIYLHRRYLCQELFASFIGRNLLRKKRIGSLGSKFFPFEKTLFMVGLGIQESKQNINYCLPCENGRKTYQVTMYLLAYTIWKGYCQKIFCQFFKGKLMWSSSGWTASRFHHPHLGLPLKARICSLGANCSFFYYYYFFLYERSKEIGSK